MMSTDSISWPGEVDHRIVLFVQAHRGVLVRLVAILLGVLLWELYASGQPDYIYPSITAIFDAFLEQVAEYNLVSRYVKSMVTLFIGFTIAAIVGITVGLGMGLNRWLDVILTPYVNAAYVAPIVALVPVIVLVGGASFWSRVSVVFLFAVFEIIIDTYEGVESTPDSAIDAVRSFGAGSWYLLRNVVIPFDLPYIFTGLRLGIGRGIKAMIIAELLIEFTNLGAVIRIWQNDFRLEGVLSVVVLLMITGVILTQAIEQIESRMVDWEVPTS